jgi:hypothetical protein
MWMASVVGVCALLVVYFAYLHMHASEENSSTVNVVEIRGLQGVKEVNKPILIPSALSNPWAVMVTSAIVIISRSVPGYEKVCP